jgi:mRNA interferase MazF
LVIKRGAVWWAELADPRGSEPGFRRPVVVVQADSFNRSQIGTVLVAVITSNLDLGEAPGNVSLSRRDSRLPRASVVNVSQLLTLDRRFLVKKVGRLPAQIVEAVNEGLRLVLSL